MTTEETSHDGTASRSTDGLERLRAERVDLLAENQRLRTLANSAEKWKGIASAKFGDGRTVQTIEEEARERTLESEGRSWSLMCERMVLAEREACAKICRDRADKIAAVAERCRSDEPDEVSALCSTAWQLIVTENEILKRSNAALTGAEGVRVEGTVMHLEVK